VPDAVGSGEVPELPRVTFLCLEQPGNSSEHCMDSGVLTLPGHPGCFVDLFCIHWLSCFSVSEPRVICVPA